MLRRSRTAGPFVLLLAVAVIVATGVCLVHLDDDGGLDACVSLLAVTLGAALVFSPYGASSLVVTRRDRYRPFGFAPPAPPPKS
jgi:hypothetical protein